MHQRALSSASIRFLLFASGLVVALLAAFLPATEVAAQGEAVDPADFNDEFVAGGVNRAVAVDWLSDGRPLLLEQTGRIVVIDPATSAVTPWIQLVDLDADAENGSLDLVVAPDNSVYVYYKAASDGRLRIGRFSFTGSATDIANETVVWSNPGPLHSTWGGTNHIGGSLTIGPDEKLYLTIGDGFNAPNAQALDSVFGKVLRINLDGSVPRDNPFYDGDGPNIDETWALGLRNPWRANWDTVTGRFWVADVGGNDATTAYEEVNLVSAGQNFGWPRCEGPLTGPKRGPDCPAGVTGPVHYYAHDADEGCCFNASITGGSLVRGIGALEGDYVYADYARGDITAVDLNGGTTELGTTLLRNTNSFIPWIEQGPDGHLYYLTFSYEGSFGELRRLRYTGELTNRAPVVRSTTASRTTGRAPLTVSFTADTFDPEGSRLSFDWDFGDGQRSTDQAPTHSYTEAGTYTARLTVSDGQLSATSAAIGIQAGIAPKVTLTKPDNAASFKAGESLSFSATATDRDGDLSPADYQWTVLFDHDDHQHPVDAVAGETSLVVEVPTTGHTFEGDTGFTVTVTVTDDDGLSTSASASATPKKINLDVDTNVAGSIVSVDGIAHSLPFVIDTVPNFEHLLQAPDTTAVDGAALSFAAWADGANNERVVVAKPGRSYTALFNSDAGRTQSGLLALYGFNESLADQDLGKIRDESGRGKPLDITVNDTSRISAGDSMIRFEKNVAAVTDATARKVTRKIAKTDAFTLEAWIDPSLDKVGARQILSIERNSDYVTAGVGLQSFKSGQVRFSVSTGTSTTGRAGTIVKSDDVRLLADQLNHVVVTRNKAGLIRLYLNSEIVATWRVRGDLQRADLQQLALGSRVVGGNFFLGDLHLAAVYSKPLGPKAVLRNYQAGPNPELATN